MIKLSKKVEYGLVALLHLEMSDPEQQVTTREMSEMYQIPEEALGKVLQKLTKGQLLESVQGAKGGYLLSHPLTQIKLGDVIEVLEGPVSTAHQGDDHTLCLGFSPCFVRGAVDEVRKHLSDYMHSVTLAEVLKNNLPSSPVAAIQEVS